jgi:hypothetical protein
MSCESSSRDAASLLGGVESTRGAGARARLKQSKLAFEAEHDTIADASLLYFKKNDILLKLSISGE